MDPIAQIPSISHVTYMRIQIVLGVIAVAFVAARVLTNYQYSKKMAPNDCDLHHHIRLGVSLEHRTDKNSLHRVVVHDGGQHLLLLREGFRFLGPLRALTERLQVFIYHLNHLPLRHRNAKGYGRKVLESVRPIKGVLASHLAMEEEALGDTLAHGHGDLFVHRSCDAICRIPLFEEEEHLVADGHIPSSELPEVPPLPLRAKPGDLVLTAMVLVGNELEPPSWASHFRFTIGDSPVANG
ncbi:uncharacterized protein PG986_011031 [Apiospora aurea]|uniref:Uncharacterized protein n=1 Tax=Apiospora aurea TaxID=335848 RepID=A0ABR1Q3Y8_9PEZI